MVSYVAYKNMNDDVLIGDAITYLQVHCYHYQLLSGRELRILLWVSAAIALCQFSIIIVRVNFVFDWSELWTINDATDDYFDSLNYIIVIIIIAFQFTSFRYHCTRIFKCTLGGINRWLVADNGTLCYMTMSGWVTTKQMMIADR